MATDTALLVIALHVGNGGAACRREAIVAGLVAEARAAGTPIVFIQHEDDWLRPGVPTWPFVLPLVADGYTTEASPTLSTAQLIAHHNRTLGQGRPRPDGDRGSRGEIARRCPEIGSSRCFFALPLPALLMLAVADGPNTIRGESL